MSTQSPLAALFAGTAERQPPQRPLIEAQYMELAIRFERLQANVPLAPGMFVREKPGCCIFKPDAPIAWIVLRMMDPSSIVDRAIIEDLIRNRTTGDSGWRYHWLCASLSNCGAGLTLHVFDANQLEPVPQDELPENVRDVPTPPGAKPRKAFLAVEGALEAEPAA